MRNNNMKRYKILKENHRVRCQLGSKLFQGAIAPILWLTGDFVAIEDSEDVSEGVSISMLSVEDTNHSYFSIA